MNEQTALLKQKYQRLREIFALARQRYIEAGGDPRCPADNRYLTNEEREEAFELGTQVFAVQVNPTVVGKRKQA